MKQLKISNTMKQYLGPQKGLEQFYNSC